MEEIAKNNGRERMVTGEGETIVVENKRKSRIIYYLVSSLSTCESSYGKNITVNGTTRI